jgi:hypothetical protein
LKDSLFLFAELGRGAARGVIGLEEFVVAGVFDGDTSVLGGRFGLEGLRRGGEITISSTPSKAALRDKASGDVTSLVG